MSTGGSGAPFPPTTANVSLVPSGSAPRAASNIYLTLQGIGFSSGYRQSFDVMVGDSPPTITGGYATWSTVKRPLTRALTIFQGYDPVQMQLAVRFGQWSPGWDRSDSAGRQVEQDIGKLEWMAGSNFREGPSPIVYVWSFSNQGGETDLIPPQYRHVPWIITGGVQWGKALRNPGGYRVWQDATFTLENYLNLSKPPAADLTVRGKYITSGPGRDTALTIAAAARSPMVDHRILAGRICADPKNNPIKGTRIRLNGRSLSWPIRHGIEVWVPQHQGS